MKSKFYPYDKKTSKEWERIQEAGFKEVERLAEIKRREDLIKAHETFIFSLCKGCYCMTKTIDGKCGKCDSKKKISGD